MLIVPVIDLKAGRVVHATGGERARYRPVESAIVCSTHPQAVAARLCEHCATGTLYLADLDALQGGAVQLTAIAALLEALPRLTLWLDAGFRQAADIDRCMQALGAPAERVQPVLASESLESLAALQEAIAAWPAALLSLDSRDGVPLDRGGLWSAAEHWPTRLIAMELGRVGSARGPDLAHMAALRSRAPHAGWIGSGGIRDEGDLVRAAASGAQAWLVASALHAGRIAPRGSAANGATDCGAAGGAGHSVSRAAQRSHTAG
ncbi:MAG TPA: HisA/HisF-related TIM barrel protein [Methylibium sp.]|uniref:HisA/HisF-related TIM barrel protein n=1 Tax=Methylibium sp. TaxID=2067992 RepID=UPI002DB7DDB9|nr:HisA/HisF-related TIM barrel protein [Methylibium sp.]HEU4459796.1 HisA/HisF-related TIM barrel protein [Methylibium sp.]